MSVVAKRLHGWIKMPLSTEVGLGLYATLCSMGTQLHPEKGHTHIPNFGPCLLWPNGWMDQDSTWHGGRPWSCTHCARWRHSCPPPKRGQSPTIFGPSLLWPNGCMDQDATWYGGRPRTIRNTLFNGDPATPRKRAHSHTQFWPMSIVAKWLDG